MLFLIILRIMYGMLKYVSKNEAVNIIRKNRIIYDKANQDIHVSKYRVFHIVFSVLFRVEGTGERNGKRTDERRLKRHPPFSGNYQFPFSLFNCVPFTLKLLFPRNYEH